ncbi:XAC0095 family protein [Dyella acidiphila]|uniref:XAC0095-like domain-containing protein n=1 Tax=Dyella acidiphila TaxID=2775866 RepID=A0ABR9G4X8_9GAMM|nr:hypothetical protein [Dyella acidiphila]MBE1159107.1 hypothetical protein [Dyella acidiphila]
MEAIANISSPSIREVHYHLPESARQSLIQIRCELDIFATLASRTSSEEDDVVRLSPTALSQLFLRMSTQMGAALDGCLTPSAYKALGRQVNP